MVPAVASIRRHTLQDASKSGRHMTKDPNGDVACCPAPTATVPRLPGVGSLLPVMIPSSTESMLRGCSARLRAFVAEAPLERSSIFEFVAVQARRLLPGVDVLDVGAGNAPYRELFAAQRYVTLDHEGTPHSRDVDLIGSASAIPTDPDRFDAVICTQVLEHVPNPGLALEEFHRVLRPGGRLIATVPFAWEEHELPHDYFRYAQPGIEYLLSEAGFDAFEVRPRTDCFTTLAQLVRNAAWASGDASDGLNDLRIQARETLAELSDALVLLAPLDATWKFPLGFTVSASLGGVPS
jgi:SAM-dependent methyltransferase